MKKIYAVLMLGAALAACSQKEQLQIIEQQEAPKTYTLSIQASKGAETKALGLDEKTLNAWWETSDEIYAYNKSAASDGSIDGCLNPIEDGSNVTINGTLTPAEAINTGDILRLGYPNIDMDYTEQKGTLESIAERYDYAYADVRVTPDEGGALQAVDATTGTTPVQFQNAQAIVKFTFLDKETGGPINAAIFTIDAKNSQGESVLIQKQTLSSTALGPVSIYRYWDTETNVIYAALSTVDDGAYSYDLSAIVTTEDENTGTTSYLYTYSKSDVTFARGKYYEITVKMTKKESGVLRNSTNQFISPDSDGNYALGEEEYTVCGTVNGNFTGRGSVTLNMVDDTEINGLVSLTSVYSQSTSTMYTPTIFLYGNATINNNGTTALQHSAEGGGYLTISGTLYYDLTVNGNVDASHIELSDGISLWVKKGNSVSGVITSEVGTLYRDGEHVGDYPDGDYYTVWTGGNEPEDTGDSEDYDDTEDSGGEE